MNTINKIIILLLAVITASILTNSPGTCDVAQFRAWAAQINELGYVQGFIAMDRNYPPLCSVILGLATRYIPYVGDLMAIKLSITGMLFLSMVLLLIWTRDVGIAGLFVWALLLNSSSHGYTDIYYIPFLIVALWAIHKGNLILFSSSYTVACLIKWLPLIIGPFLLIYCFARRDGLKLWKFALKGASPAIALCLVVVSLYGVKPLYDSWEKASADIFFSGYAINFNWVSTYYMRVFKPRMFGKLSEGGKSPVGECQLIRTRDKDVIRLPKILFASFYCLSLAVFLCRKKNLENTVLFSLLGFLSYFMFNIGIHENHLFIGAFLSVLLVWLNRKYLYPAILVIAMSNLNHIVFYGLLGRELGCSRVLFGLDLSIILAILYILSFVAIYVQGILISKSGGEAVSLGTTPAAAEPPPETIKP